jgi:hypothetical protein
MPSTIPYTKSGTVTITGVATTSAVAFTTAMPDTSYAVVLDQETPAGAAVGFESPWVTLKATTGFTININTAPGGILTVQVNWQAIEHHNP